MLKFKMNENSFRMDTEYDELSISTNSSYGFRPFQLMVASIAGCSSAALKVVMNKMRMQFTDIEVLVKTERNEGKANRIEKIHLHFIITGENLLQEKIEKAAKVARKNCAMVHSVENSIEITESYEVKKQI